MIMAPFVTCSAMLLPIPLKQVIRCHSVSLRRLPSLSLKLRLVASETVVTVALLLVSRTSGVLPTKPTRVTEFFVVLTFRSSSLQGRDQAMERMRVGARTGDRSGSEN